MSTYPPGQMNHSRIRGWFILGRRHIARRHQVGVAPRRRFVRELEELAEVVDIGDPAVVACAVQSGSEAIVTGDQHLLDLGRYQDIVIGRPAEFLVHLLRRPSSPGGA